MPLSNIYNFLKYHPIFLQIILDWHHYLCPHLCIKICLVFHPLPSKISYRKPPLGSYTKIYSTFKDYDADIPLSNIYNFFKYYPIFLQNILNWRPYFCLHNHMKTYLVFHPLRSKISYRKTPQRSYTEIYSTFKDYNADIPLSNIYNFFKY